MKAVIARSEVRGSVPAVPSKSHAHRLLIAAALSPAPCKLVCPVTSRDIDATVRCLNALGARIERTADGFDITPVDRENLPLSPTLDCGESGSTLRFLLPVACALRKGGTHIVNAGRLRIKECDRLAATAEGLNALGAKVKEGKDDLFFDGVEKLAGGAEIKDYHDHRMVMAFAVAATVCEKEVVINGCESVSKSYPDFFEDMKKLGAKFRIEV